MSDAQTKCSWGFECSDPDCRKGFCRPIPVDSEGVSKADTHNLLRGRECSHDPPCEQCTACELVQYDLCRSAVREALQILSGEAGGSTYLNRFEIQQAEDLLRRALR